MTTQTQQLVRGRNYAVGEPIMDRVHEQESRVLEISQNRLTTICGPFVAGRIPYFTITDYDIAPGIEPPECIDTFPENKGDPNFEVYEDFMKQHGVPR